MYLSQLKCRKSFSCHHKLKSSCSAEKVEKMKTENFNGVDSVCCAA